MLTLGHFSFQFVGIGSETGLFSFQIVGIAASPHVVFIPISWDCALNRPPDHSNLLGLLASP
jgi:hypothetical protein